MGGPGCQRLSGSKVKQKQKTGGPEGGPGPQGSSGLVPRWGEGGGRDGSVGRPDGRRAPSVGLTNGAVGAVGVGCTVAWAAKMHALSLVLRGFGYEIAPAARCFCFLNRGPGPSEAASQRPLNERSKTLGPGPRGPTLRQQCAAGSAAPEKTTTVLDSPHDRHISHARDGAGSKVSPRRLTSLSPSRGVRQTGPSGHMSKYVLYL